MSGMSLWQRDPAALRDPRRAAQCLRQVLAAKVERLVARGDLDKEAADERSKEKNNVV